MLAGRSKPCGLFKDRGFWGWRDSVAVRELALPVADLGSFPRWLPGSEELWSFKQLVVGRVQIIGGERECPEKDVQ